MSAPPPRRLHPLWKASVGLLLAGALILLVEGGLLLAGIPGAGLYVGDPAILWTLRPQMVQEVPAQGARPAFQVQTNALGLRGPMPPDSGPWTLALGCSTTFGWGVAQEEAWPARLQDATGEPVVNGGVPGWSSEQAVRGASEWMRLGPSRIILAYGVRDAWPAAVPDADRAETPWWRAAAVYRFLNGALRPSGGQEPAALPPRPAEQARVSPPRFVENLRTLVAQAGDAEVLFLAFPLEDPAPTAPWMEQLHALGPTVAPTLPPGSWFSDDPIHLTPSGHAALAQAVAAAL